MGEMMNAALLNYDLEPVQNPTLSDIATKLLTSISDMQDPGSQNLALVQEVLAYASEAEQQLADQKQRISHLESLAVTDELTGLLNRRGFQEALDRTLAEAARYDETGLLAFIDLDGFKDVNDTHGHEAGDDVLRAVADCLIEELRSTDYVARLAGDEFVLLFVRADRAARERALALRSKLNRLMVPYRGDLIRVRASMGIQTYGKTSAASDLLRRADKAMYRDKEARA